MRVTIRGEDSKGGNFAGHSVLVLLFSCFMVTVVGCGGGSTRPDSPPGTIVCSDGTVVPRGHECPPQKPESTGPLPGIERIPRSAIRATPAEAAGMYTILEFNYGAADGHAVRVSRTACESHILGCDAGRPFNLISADDLEEEGRRDYNLADAYRYLVPSTTKIVSGSFAPSSTAMGELTRQNTPFAFIQAAGNSPTEDGSDPASEFGHWRNAWNDSDIAAALRNNKVLVVAGYRIVDGEYIRDEGSVSCEGVEEHCLYAPFMFQTEDGERYFGTSHSVPQVASALGSVLAVFPDTESTELVKLAKACAVAEERLNGLGRADFTCMTVMSDGGQWQVVGVDDILSPLAMQGMQFPGRASMSGTFANSAGNEITLGLTSLGLFTFTPGVPVITEDSVTGFFPIALGEEDEYTLGVGYVTDSGWFGRVAHGRRDSFFGLGSAHGYAGSTAMDADVGHRSVFARLSWQKSDSTRLIHKAEGIAVGLGAQHDVYQDGGFTIGVAGNVSKFLRGSADTAFGPVSIGESRWNHEVSATATYEFQNDASFEVAVDHQEFGGADIKAAYRVRF